MEPQIPRGRKKSLFSLQFDDWVEFRFVWVDLVVSAGFKTIRLICNDSVGFRFLLIDVGRFYAISTIWRIGVDSDIFGNI